MGKEILDIVKDFASWQGNTYTLAALIVEKQKELDRQALVAGGFADAAGAI